MSLIEVIFIIKNKFWLVVAGALIAGAVALALSLIWPTSYEAEAMLLITKLRPSITLDPRYETVAEENVVNLSIQDDQVRRQTLVALTESSDLVLKVIDRLGDTLLPEERTTEYLRSVTGVGTRGNLMVFTAKAEDPDGAAAIANAWAGVFEEHVNRLYSATSPTYDQVEAQLADAEADYESAKTGFEDFVLQSNDEELTRQIEQKRKILAELEQEYLSSNRRRAYRLLSRLETIDRLLVDSRNLQAQLVGSPSATPLTEGEGFALFALQSETFADSMASEITLELGTGLPADSNLTAEQAADHIERLMVILEAARTATETDLENYSLDLLSGRDLLIQDPNSTDADSIEQLQQQINELETALQSLTMEKQDLSDALTVAQESYFTLVRKAAEVQILSELTGVEVQRAAYAQPPEEPASPSPLVATVLGAMAGGLAGLVLIFVLEWWPREEEPVE